VDRYFEWKLERMSDNRRVEYLLWAEDEIKHMRGRFEQGEVAPSELEGFRREYNNFREMRDKLRSLLRSDRSTD
jgi:hypothetical protein